MKKRIAVWYESRLGRNDGNPLYITQALKRMQEAGADLEVEHLAPIPGLIKKFGHFDLHIWVDWGEDGLTGVLPYEPVFPPGRPIIYWASDTHLGYKYRLSRALEADYVFAAQIEAVRDFKRDGVKNPILLPHAVEPVCYRPGVWNPEEGTWTDAVVQKEYDVCFVGYVNSENRIAALDALFKAIPNFFWGQRRFEEASQVYSRSKIVFNISMKRELNMRVFEAMASGSMLLTDDIPMIHNYFKDGEHLVLYKDHKDMIEKAKYYIEHEEEREKIAQAGLKAVLAKHTIDHRLQEMLKVAKIVLP